MIDKKSEIMLSVVIPIYNTDIKKLKRCLKSILDQSFEAYEVIIVDDGNSKEYVTQLNRLEMADSRISIVHKLNNGVSAARNFGTSLAKGKYVMYIDGDDLLPQRRFEQAVQIAIEKKADILIGRSLQIDEERICNLFEPENEESRLVECEILDEGDKSDFVCQILIKHVRNWGRNKDNILFNGEGCWSYVVKKEVAQNNSFPEGIAVGEDTIWAIKLLKKGVNLKICLVDNLWYYYIQNEESVLHKYNPKFAEEISKAVSVLNDIFIRDEGKEKAAYLEWIQYKQKQIINKCYLNENAEMTLGKKIIAYIQGNNTSPWKEILQMSKRNSMRMNVKCLFYRTGLMMLIQYCKKAMNT